VEKRRRHIGFWWENLRERDLLEILGLDRRIIIKGTVKKIGSEFVGWIRLPQDTDRWRLLVNTVSDF
jgi:hypothetical protein